MLRIAVTIYLSNSYVYFVFRQKIDKTSFGYHFNQKIISQLQKIAKIFFAKISHKMRPLLLHTEVVKITARNI